MEYLISQLFIDFVNGSWRIRIQLVSFCLLCCCGVFNFAALNAQVGINLDNSPPDSSAILDIKSNSQGFLTPRMTEAERNAIPTPATGLLVYQTDGTFGFYYNQGDLNIPDWIRLGSDDDDFGCDPRTPIDSVLFQDFQNGRFTEYLITEPGSYYLTGNIDNLVSGKTAITILSDNVTLDLNGYSLLGPQSSPTSNYLAPTGSPGNGHGIWLDGALLNVTIQSGTISSWGESGIKADETSGSIFRDLRLENNGTNGIEVGDKNLLLRCQSTLNLNDAILTSNGNNVINCTTMLNGGRGIVADSIGLIINSAAFDNKSTGIEVNQNGMILGCVSSDNVIGFFVGSFSQAIKCNAYDNEDDGFQIADQGHVLHCNSSFNNEDGFELMGASGSIRHCVAHENDTNGIYCSNRPISAILVSHNGITDNDTKGLLVDGTGAFVISNRAAGNTNLGGLNGVGDGNYDLNPQTKYGPIINVTNIGDVSAVNQSDNQLANYTY